MTTTETVADVMADFKNSLAGSNVLKYWHDRIESALASAEPVAFVRPSDLRDLQSIRDQGLSMASILVRLEVEPGWTAGLFTHTQPTAKVEAPGYKLSDAQLATLLSEGLKPEEICGTAEVQHARVGELVRWFARLATGSANPKWARSHAFELAYFVATNAGNRHIDINKVREAGFKEGAMVSPQDRGSLERIGFLQPMPAPTPASVPDGVYLSGPMSGLQDLNFPAFHAAAKELRANGHRVISPAEINAAHPGEWASCMRADIRALCDCETLALLPGWESSRGAHLELHLAHRLGLKIVSVAGLMFTTPEPTP